jgi:hypothetical protein
MRSSGQGSSRARGGLQPEEEGVSDGWGHPVSKRREGGGVPIRGRGGVGPWAGSGGRPDSVQRPLSPFFFVLLFFCFSFLISYLFITFAKMHQIHSNQFLNFSKNQHNVLKQ